MAINVKEFMRDIKANGVDVYLSPSKNVHEPAPTKLSVLSMIEKNKDKLAEAKEIKRLSDLKKYL